MKVPIPTQKLRPRPAQAFYLAANRLAGKFVARPSEITLLHFLLLPRILGLGLQQGKLNSLLRDYPENLDTLEVPSYPAREDTSFSTAAKKATHLLEAGFLGRASRTIVDNSPLAPIDGPTLHTLREKHPIGPAEPFSRQTNPSPGQKIPIEAILATIGSISKEKAAGPSGWTRHLLDLAIAKDSAVPELLRLLADMIRQGTAPGRDLLTASRLIALKKKDGGIRPIAIGDMLYRVATKTILATLYQDGMLLPNQLGVGSPGGVEPAVFLLSEVITGGNRPKARYIGSLDAENAFNALPRKAIAATVSLYAPVFYRSAQWAYNHAAVLFLEDRSTIASSSGVRQGDPLSAFFWSLAYRPTLEAAQKALPDDTFISYLDDTYIISRDKDPRAKVFQAFQDSPIRLNPYKSSFYSLEEVRKDGLSALGTYIGPLEHRRTFLQGKINTLKTVLATLETMPKQHALLLLRGSITFLLRHLLRQLAPSGLEDLYHKIDQLTLHIVEKLASKDPSAPIQANQDLLALPARMGGLGLTLYAEMPHTHYSSARKAAAIVLDGLQKGTLLSSAPAIPPTGLPADLASCPAPSWGVQVPPAGPEGPGQVLVPPDKPSIKDINQERLQRVKQQLTLQGQRALLENSTYLSRKWLEVLPTSKQTQLADFQVTEGLRVRLILPVRPLQAPCTYCGAIVTIGHEDTCKGAERHWKIRHDAIVKALFNAAAATLDPKLEPKPQGTQGPRPDLSTTLNGSVKYYDVQIVAINKPSAREDPYEALSEAADAKKVKYRALGPQFSPIIISAGGLMEKSTAKTYKDLQTTVGPVAAAWLDTMVSQALYKARAHSSNSIARKQPPPSTSWAAIREGLRGRPSTQPQRLAEPTAAAQRPTGPAAAAQRPTVPAAAAQHSLGPAAAAQRLTGPAAAARRPAGASRYMRHLSEDTRRPLEPSEGTQPPETASQRFHREYRALTAAEKARNRAAKGLQNLLPPSPTLQRSQHPAAASQQPPEHPSTSQQPLGN